MVRRARSSCAPNNIDIQTDRQTDRQTDKRQTSIYLPQLNGAGVWGGGALDVP
jgi:hypothetical protein